MDFFLFHSECSSFQKEEEEEEEMEQFGMRIPDPTTNVDLPENTLDEPVYMTVWRDLRLIGIKTFHVLVPTGRGPLVLRDWDLWGPLLYCFLFSIFVSIGSNTANDAANIFTGCFCIIWLGCGFITINAKLLKGHVSFWQALSVLGYCVFPVMIAAFMLLWWGNIIYRLVTVACAVIWSSWATVAFFSDMALDNKRPLVVYPVLLFYLILGWITLVLDVSDIGNK